MRWTKLHFVPVLTTLSVLFTGAGVLGQVPEPEQTPAHVIITAGQSNTDGRVPNKQLPAYIKALATDKTNFNKGAYKYCRINQNSNSGSFTPFYPKGRITEGLWAYDAVTYYWLGQSFLQPFYVIKYAVGGTSIQYPKTMSQKGRYWSADPDFLSKTTSYEKGGHSLLLSFTDAIDEAIDNTLSKLKGGYQIDAFLWHQGESDGKYDDKYYENLKEVVAYVRKHLTEKTGKDYTNLPFIFGSIPVTNRDYSPVVDFSMKRIAEEDPNAYLVDMSRQHLQGDHLHFTAESAAYLGKKMYGILARILHLNPVGFSIAKYLDNKNCAISFTFDDGLAEQATLVAPFFNKLGLKATFFVNGRSISDTAGNGGKPRVSWQQLREMADQGHEIASHGWQHRNFGKFPLEEIKRDINKNDSAIYKEIGRRSLTFAYANNTKKTGGMMEVYKSHIASRLFQISLGSKWTSADLDKRLAKLIAAHDWEVTMTHGITYGYDHFKDTSILWNYLRKVKAEEDKIWVGTFYQVAAYTKEQKAVTFDIRQTKAGFTITPDLPLDKTVYTEPLTGVVNGRQVKRLTVTQKGQRLKTHIKGGNWLFNFDPFGGEITVRTR